MLSIAENIKVVRDRIEAAVKRSGRDPSEIKLVAVSKTVDIDRIKEAVIAGITILGENRVQEAQKKVASYELRVVGRKIEWHMVGHLQTNKAKTAIRLFDLIHSVDSLRLAEEIDRESRKTGKVQDVLVEVNLAGEETKHGVSKEGTISLLKEMSKLKNISVKGLMTMPPFSEDPEKVRPYFRRLREIRDNINELRVTGYELRDLSMGMSNDFEVAIEEGATMVRVGTAIFGERR
ncbi:MAG: YggS family pyridoxal phosphate-dependent enzyme [Nitrospirae bacterium]|nr:YggS family pyridoxal phosphate-dependent enzyme [Nitrospirota bacterium]